MLRMCTELAGVSSDPTVGPDSEIAARGRGREIVDIREDMREDMREKFGDSTTLRF